MSKKSEAKAAAKAALQPHERRLWPEKGDADAHETYAAVGQALSDWEVFEAYFSLLFACFVSPASNPIAARRAYASIRTFEARWSMVDAASEWFFAFYKQLAKSKKQEFNNLLGFTKSIGGRRNEIAHGCVQPYFRKNDLSYAGVQTVDDGWFLVPSYVSAKKFRRLDDMPEYAYASAEILYFAEQFRDMSTRATELVSQLKAGAHSSPDTLQL